VNADGSSSSEFASAVGDVMRFAAHNLWAFVLLVAITLGLMTRFSFGGWVQLQLRLLAAVAVAPISVAQLYDANFLLGQLTAAIVLVVLASWTIGSTDWWAKRVDDLPPTVLPVHRHIVKLFLLSTLRSAVVLVALKATVSGWSWYLRPAGRDSGPVPVMPASAAGFDFRAFASKATAEWGAHAAAGHTAAAPDVELPASGGLVAASLASSSWVLFNPEARHAMSVDGLTAQARGWVQYDCPSCAGSDDISSKRGVQRLALSAAGAVRAHPHLQPPGIGQLGVGVVHCPGCVARNASGARSGRFMPPSPTRPGAVPAEDHFFSLGREGAYLHHSHAWAPFPVLATAAGSGEVAQPAGPWLPEWARARADGALMHAFYLSTVALWTALELGLVKVAPRGDVRRGLAYFAMTAVHALAVGLFKTHGRLISAGVGFPEVVWSLLRVAPVPMLAIGLVSLLMGTGTSTVIKLHFGVSFAPLVAIVAVNLVATLWASRAGELLAEAVAVDVAASEHFGVTPAVLAAAAGAAGGVGEGAMDAAHLVGAGVLSGWATPGGVRSAAVASLSGAGLLSPMFLPAAVLSRVAAVAFAAWVFSLWWHVVMFAQRAGGVFLLELRNVVPVGGLTAREAPTLVSVVRGIVTDLMASHNMVAGPEAAAGGGGLPGQRAQAGGDESSAEIAIGRAAMSALGLWIGVDRLRQCQERLVLAQALDAQALNFGDADVDTGRLSLRLSVAPSAVQEEARAGAELVGAGTGFVAAAAGAFASMFPAPPAPVRPLITARFSGIRAQGNASFVARREARLCMEDPGHVPEPAHHDAPGPQPVSLALELEVGMKAIAEQLNALRSGTALGRVELSVIVDPPAPSSLAPTSWLGAAARTIAALAEAAVPRRAEFPLLTVEDGRATGVLANRRKPTWQDLRSQSANLTKASGSIHELVGSLQERMHTRAAQAAAGSAELIRRLGLLSLSVARVSEQLERMRTSSRPKEAAKGIQAQIMDTAFLVTTVHAAEAASSPNREATKVVFVQLISCLVELATHTFMDSFMEDDKPLLTIGTAGLLLAMQVFVFRDSRSDLADQVGTQLGDVGLARDLLMVDSDRGPGAGDAPAGGPRAGGGGGGSEGAAGGGRPGDDDQDGGGAPADAAAECLAPASDAGRAAESGAADVDPQAPSDAGAGGAAQPRASPPVAGAVGSGDNLEQSITRNAVAVAGPQRSASVRRFMTPSALRLPASPGDPR